jgi:hypothetical protein
LSLTKLRNQRRCYRKLLTISAARVAIVRQDRIAIPVP